MTLPEVVAECARLNVKLAVDGTQLRVRATPGTVSADLRVALTEHKNALIQRLANGPGGRSGAARTTPRTGEYPLSYSQHSLWLLHQAEPASLPAYNVRAARRFRGALDVERLEEAIRSLIRRHDPLRTVFVDHDGSPMQRVLEEVEFRLDVRDLSSLDQAEREALWRADLDNEGLRVFDTGTAPLFAVKLFRIAADDHILILNAHHLIADAWSAGLLLREIAAAYGSTDADSNRADPAFGFPDYVVDQRRRLEGDGLTPHLDYWKRQLDGLPPLELPADFPRAQVPTYRGASIQFELDASVRDFARREGVTVFQVLLAAYAVLLHRLSGQTDFGIGYTLAGRDLLETENLLGYFVNLVVLRPDLSGLLTFRSLLRQVRQKATEAFQHQEAPFDRIVRELRVPRESGRNPLFQTMFLYLQGQRNEAEFAGIETASLPVPSVTAKYDLSLHVEDLGAGLTCLFEYSTDLFRAGTIGEFGTRFIRLLTAGLANPEAPLQTLPVLGHDERRRLLEGFNATGHPIPAGTIPGIFEEQVARTPNAIALVSDDQSLSYRYLNEQANRVAHHLIARGVGPEDVVGIRMERCPEMIVAMLGVQKAGAAFVPLDPGYPEARLAFMMEDAAPAAVLDSDYMSRLDATATWNPKPKLLPDHPAYIIYTSGSTGRPKGVVVTQSAIHNYIRWAGQFYFGDGEGNMALFTSPAFDLTLTSIFVPLSLGRTVHCFRDRDVSRLLEAVFAAPLDAIKLTPSHISILETLSIRPAQIRVAIVGGEELTTGQVNILRRWAPGVRIYNEYGPTEATIGCTVRHVVGDSTPDIGSPIWNTRSYVLNEALEPVPVGVAGELFLAGADLARGYLKRPDLTAERFIPDPYGEPGSRIYRTGDLARWRADGNLECLGRIDHQVKIRGLRIELGEIESLLLAQPGVAQAVVVARDDAPGAKLLAAYVTPATLDVAAVRQALSERLPDYMVPSAFVLLNELPLSASGKLDRRALPAPLREAQSWRAPETPAQEILCRLFAELLSLPRVGIDDNFFSLGGDSIVSIVLVSRARKAGLALTPRDVFQHQTARALAAVAQQPSSQKRHEDATGEVIPTPIMRWLFERGGPFRRYSQSVLLRVPASLREADLIAGLQAVVNTHSMLRVRLESKEDGGWGLRIGPPDSLQARSCLRTERGPIDASAAIEAEARLDPGEGRVLEAVWFPDAARLLLVIHHLAVDGVSWRILVPDLAAACQGMQLEPESTPFRVWAEHLKRLAASESVKADLAACEVGSLVRRSVPNAAHARSLRVSLNAAQTATLLTRVPEAFHARIDEILLAALAIAGGGEMLVDVEGHGREANGDEFDLSRTVGWFTTLYPVRLDAGGLGLNAAVKRIKEQLRSIPGRGLSYGLLRYLNPETGPRLAGRGPARIGFNYLGRVSATESAEWSLAPEELHLTGSDPDLPAAHAIEINAITSDVLTATWSWSVGVEDESTVAGLADAWLNTLAALVLHIEQAGAGGHSPSDFALVDLSQTEVEQVESLYPGLEDILPLTPLQEGLLFHSLFDETAPDAYTVQVALTLGGDLDAGRLRRAAEAMLARYPNLRAAVCLEGLPKPVQAITRNVQLPWREVDAPADLEALLAADRAERFSLSTGPLLRFTLARLARDRHLLVLTNHHILMDGWSLPVFFEELLAVYAGDSLPPARPYAGYLTWLRQQDTGKAYARWKQYLSTLEEPTRIARAQERAGVWQAPVRRQMGLSPDLTARLQNLARERGVTLNTIFQGLWAVLLWRLSGKSKVVFGVTVSGRPAELPGVERMVGLFINTLPMRAEINPLEPLAAYLARIQHEQAAMLEFQQVSMAEIQRTASLGELFDTLLVFENYPLERAAFPQSAGIRIEEVEGRDTSHYPLSLIVVPGEKLQLRLDYDPARFEGSFAESIGVRFVRLLEGAVARPGALLHELRVLDFAERRMLLEPQYRPLATPSVEATLPELFESQVRRTPDKIALVYGEATLTYGGLNEQANRLAHRLIAMGVGPESLVAFRLEPSFATVVAILGIQKAGGAYLPIDAEYPPARVQGMLADAQPVCLLTAEWFAENRAAIAQANATNPRRALPGNAAYVIYTSGSTGKPKGVPVTHQNVVRLFHSTSPWFSFTSDDVWTLFHSSAFDFSVWEIWGALLHGGRLVVVPKLVTRSPEEFLNLLVDQKVTVLNQTPSAFYQLMAADRENPGQRLSLRTIVFGGEALDLSRLDDWYSKHADNAPVLVNMYGITETTVHVSYVALDRMMARQSRGSMIGGNIPDLRVYVLDSELEPVPVGVTGEMYVAGAGLARGYLKRPELTAERFLPDPHGEPGTRMYRTGDLARWVVPGSLDYLGRADQQVKIRGFRIELGEIEAALAGLEGVVQAAVIARDSGAGGRQLIAYVVPRPGVACDAAVLRQSLNEKLPDYMLPAAFVMLEALPLTQHGKLDRAALPVPAVSSGGTHVAPRDSEEIAIAGVWEDVLERNGIGVTDNFFALGGHSLLATQVMSRLRERCGVKLPLRVLFEQPTVEGLARSVRALKSTAEPVLPQLRRVARQKRQITVNERGEVGQAAGSGN